MYIISNNKIQKITAGVLLSLTLIAPISALAQSEDMGSGAEATQSGGELGTGANAGSGAVSSAGAGIAASCGLGFIKQAVGYGIGLVLGTTHQGLITGASKAELTISVPTTRIAADDVKEGVGTGQGQKNAIQYGDFWANLMQQFKGYCLDPLARKIAIAIIKQMRNMVINYINTGNFGGKPTFVTNFQFDAKQTARNAARLFASELTNIDFCNYFPQNPRVDLNFELNLRIGLQCSFQKSPEDYVLALRDPGSLEFVDEILLDFPENDSNMVYSNKAKKLAIAVKQAKTARQTQVTAGKGYIGIEKCVREKIIEEGYYINEATAERCDNMGETGPPEGCDYVPPVTVCEETKTQTPGSFVADIATEPLKSEFREGEAIHTFEEAIGAIIDALVSKVINQGLNAVVGQ